MFSFILIFILIFFFYHWIALTFVFFLILFFYFHCNHDSNVHVDEKESRNAALEAWEKAEKEMELAKKEIKRLKLEQESEVKVCNQTKKKILIHEYSK